MTQITLTKGKPIILITDDSEAIAASSDYNTTFDEKELEIQKVDLLTHYKYSYNPPYPVKNGKNIIRIEWSVDLSWSTVALPLIRKTFGSIAASNFLSVQPMTAPTGLVFSQNMSFGMPSGSATFVGKVLLKAGTKLDLITTAYSLIVSEADVDMEFNLTELEQIDNNSNTKYRYRFKHPLPTHNNWITNTEWEIVYMEWVK